MTFSVLGVTGSYYGLAVGLSALCYLGLMLLLQRKSPLKADAVLLYGVLGIPLGLIVSRAVYSAANFNYFFLVLEQPGKMLYFWDGGYSMAGMLLGLVLAVLIAAKIAKYDFRRFLDAASLPLGLLLFGLRLAEGLTENFGVGRQVDPGALAQSLPVLFISESFGAIELHRLAVFRYEAVFALLLLLILFLFARGKNRRDGDLSMLFFALYGAAQIVFESMRNDGHMVYSFVRVQQVLALLSILIVLGMFCRRYGKAHGARDAVTAAWTMLPVLAVVLWMMIKPINHMLDLTGHIGIGLGVLAAMGVYLAFFLRLKGANLRLILSWFVTLGAVAASVMLEFSLDGSTNIFRDYGLLALCAAILFLAPYSLYVSLGKGDANA
ncbi:MAG: prolipoprotein diacylglyceryl transferase [Firmicutes bacterium]|nr:prolipoprotein diacylglyceryl transferase [Bacillota bacterium]